MENSFDEAMARDWLNQIISCMKQRSPFDVFNNQIRTIGSPDDIQLFKGIEILSDLLGLKLQDGGKNENYNEYYFLFNGVKVFQLSEERLVGYETI